MTQGFRTLGTDEALARPRPTVAPSVGVARGRHLLGRDWASAWLFLAPCMLVLVGLIGYPFVSAILLSFQAKLVGSPGAWVGLQNYYDLLFGRDLRCRWGHHVLELGVE